MWAAAGGNDMVNAGKSSLHQGKNDLVRSTLFCLFPVVYCEGEVGLAGGAGIEA